MKKIIIFGAGQTAEILYHYFTKDSEYDVIAFTVNSAFIESNRFLGLPVVAFEDVEKIYPPSDFGMFVAASYCNINQLREEMYNSAKKKNYTLVTYISSKAGIFSDMKVGDNCLILENEIIQPYTVIGNNVFVWGGVVIGHHSEIRDHCWLTSGSSIGGNTIIKARTFLGLNCTVGHMIEIGSDNFIGANALVTKTTKDNNVFIEKDTDKFGLDSERFILISKMK